MAIPKGVPGEFRPITLKNALSKIFERVLYGRIHHWIDNRLPDYQFGFRRKLGCREQLIRLINYLQVEREQKRVSVVLFLDIRKAYDRVYRKALIAKLYKHGMRGNMLRMIDRLISNTRCRVLNRGHVSGEYTPSDGIPQGSVLSCLAWNMNMVDLATPRDENTMHAAYADDLASIVSDRDLHTACLRMTQIYGKIREWARFNRVEFNDKKVKAMIIKPRWKRDRKNDKVHTLDSVLYEDSKTRIVRRVEYVQEY